MLLFSDDKSYYILYCCTHCDEKFGSEDALQQHIKTCKLTTDITWIKQEPQEEGDCGQSPQDRTTPTPATPATLPLTPQIATSTPIRSPQSLAPFPVSEIKTEPGHPLQSTVPAVCEQQVVPHTGVPQQGVFRIVMPQLLVPNQAVVPQQVLGQSQGPPQLLPLQASGLRQASQPRLPQQTNPAPTPQYHDAAKHLTASEILRQRYQKMQPPPSSEIDKESLSKVRHRGGRKKRTPIPMSTATRSIRPKEAPASATVHSFTVEPQSNADPCLPKIERVYYTSKTDADSIGQATLAGSAHKTVPVSKSVAVVKSQKKHAAVSKAMASVPSQNQPLPVSKTMTAVQSLLNQPSPVSKAVTAGPSQSQPSPVCKAVASVQPLPASSVVTTTGPQLQSVAVSGGVAIVQPQQSIIPTMQTLHQAPQALQQAPQTLQQTAQTLQQPTQAFIQTPQGLIQVPQTFLQNPPSLFQSSQTLFHSPQSLLQNTQSALQQSLLQQNLLQAQAQAAQQSFQSSLLLNGQAGSQLMPVLPPQHITVQTSCSGATAALTTQPATPVSVAESAAPTITTPASSETALVGSKPAERSRTVVTPLCKPAVSAPNPVTALSQLVGGISTTPTVGQRVQIAVPNPGGAGIILLTGNLKPGASIAEQTVNQQNSPAALGNQPVVTPNTLGIPSGIANPQQGFVPQNPSPNVLFLPPMMSQGHVLSGIHIQQPELVSPVTTPSPALQTAVQENLTPKETKSPAQESSPPSSADNANSKSKTAPATNAQNPSPKIVCEPPWFCPKPVRPRAKRQQLTPKRKGALSFAADIADNSSGSSTGSSRKEGGKNPLSSPATTSCVKSSSSNLSSVVPRDLLSDKTVLDIAKLLLFEDQKMKEKGPVILDDGRIFVPVAYTGPYTLRNTKMPPKQLVKILPDWPWLKMKKKTKSDGGEKKDDVKDLAERTLEENRQMEENDGSPPGRTLEEAQKKENDHSDAGKTLEDSKGGNDHSVAENTPEEDRKKEENEPYLPQTITLPGDVVWIFLDKDGPKILWKLEGVKQQVMVLPLDYDLPVEAMKQMAEMLSRIKVDFPFGPLSHCSSQASQGISDVCLEKALTLESDGHRWYNYTPFTQKLTGHKADLELLSKMEQILSKKNQPILPKGRPPNAPPPLKVRPPSNPSAEEVLKRANTLMSITPKGPPPPALISAAQCVPATLHTSIIKLEPDRQDPPQCSDKHNLPQSGASLHSSQDVEQLHSGQGQGQRLEASVTFNASQSKGGERRQSDKPQLTVMADASIIKRALEAFVSLERIPLSDTQQRYLKSHRVTGERNREPRTLKRTADPSCDPKQITEAARQKKRGRKPKWLKELEQKNVSEHVLKDVPGSSESFSRQARGKQKLTMEGEHSEKKRGRPQLKKEDEDFKPGDDSFGTVSASQQMRGKGQLRLTNEDEEREYDGRKQHEACESVESAEKMTTGREGERRRKKRKRLSQQINWSESDDDEVTDAAWAGRKSSEKSGGKRRRTKSGLKMELEEEELDISGGGVEAGVRRSIRIFCKPKPDYWSLDSQDFMDEDLDPDVHRTGDDELENIAGTAKVKGDPDTGKKNIDAVKAANSDATVEASPSAFGSRSLGKHAGFDVYVETADDKEDEEGRLIIDNKQNKEDTVREHGESEECTADQFLHKHKGDFEQIVMKDVKKNEDTGDGARGHILYLCTICGSFQSRSRDELISHLKQHHNGELTCQVCKFSAASRQELIEHEALEHTGKPLYHCHVCKTPFFSQTIFQNHLKRHNVAIACKVCSAEFPNEGGLKEHLEREHAQEYICHLCDQRFVSEDKVS